MKPRSLVILGSTGSIGRSCLDVVAAHPESFVIKALAAHSNVELLAEQYRAFHPEYLCLIDSSHAKLIAQRFAGERVRILIGQDELLSLVTHQDVDLVVNAIVGAAGLKASYEAVKAGKTLALANKESLVAGGPLFQPLIRAGQARILPIDSEHSAVWQAMCAGKPDEVRSIILTASGGPFRQFSSEMMNSITVEQALDHPTWKMGHKVTIDSATLANKGLEVIEAVTLFSFSPDQIKVVVNPQSIVHSMVEFIDSSVLAQLSQPDMRLPITYALFWPHRVESGFGRIDWTSLGELTFELPDRRRFPMLDLAYEVARKGGTAPAAFNAANEIAVDAFLNRRVKFTEIADIVTDAVARVASVAEPALDDIMAADRAAREYAQITLEKAKCC